MKPGELNKIVVIKQRSEATNSNYGGTTKTWSTYATVWAKVVPLSSKEFMSAQAYRSEISLKVFVRFTTGVDATMRVEYDNNTYEIVGEPINISGRGQFLEMLVKKIGEA